MAASYVSAFAWSSVASTERGDLAVSGMSEL
jgi:hypothetical protein